MDIETVRDWVVIVAGIIWMLLTLVLAAVFGALTFGSAKGLRLADRLLTEKGRPALDKVHTQLVAVRDRTSRLPPNEPLPEAEARPARSGGGLRLPLPGRRKRRLPFLGR